MQHPLVSIVTVNYNGRRFLDRLLDSLAAQTYEPKEIVVVDNASSDGSVEHLRRHHPGVKVAASAKNLGFSGGNNLGARQSRGQYIALINNDALPDPSWLAELVADLAANPRAGAVASKVTFLKPFMPVRIETRGARLLLGAQSRFIDCDYLKPLHKAGWSADARVGDVSGKCFEREAEVWLPVERTDRPARLRLQMAALGGAARANCTVRIGADVLAAEAAIGQTPCTLEYEVPPQLLSSAYYVINNAGSRLDELGNAADRGIGEADRAQYDRAEEVESLCACAMLVRREVFEAAGGFDETFFMYYEDTDLSWRIRKLGYTLRYQPRSVVRHAHAASSVEWSPFFVFHVARNRVLISLKNSPLRHALTPFWDELGRLFRCAARCMAALLTRRRVPAHLAEELATRLRVQWSLLGTAPRILVKRWSSP